MNTYTGRLSRIIDEIGDVWRAEETLAHRLLLLVVEHWHQLRSVMERKDRYDTLEARGTWPLCALQMSHILAAYVLPTHVQLSRVPRNQINAIPRSPLRS